MPHAKANGLSIYFESHGADDAEPILLIMGLGAQMSRWSPELIGKLVAAGHRVIAFDNRDVGLTEKLDGGQFDEEDETLAVALVFLLIIGMRNSWDMATFMITRQKQG